MAVFLNTTQTLGEIENMITTAKRYVVLISPYIKINENLISRLNDAVTRRKINIKLICRKGDLKPDEKAKIVQINNLDLLFNEKVHAKCFYNESIMVITSLNLYNSTSGDNHEMGILLNEKEDDQAFLAAIDESQYIIGESTRTSNKDVKSKPILEKSQKNFYGYCIRCTDKIAFEMEKPYCIKCFNKAKHNIDGEFEPIERFCHYDVPPKNQASCS